MKQKSYRRHFIDKHGIEPRLGCEHCDKTFSRARKYQLTDHSEEAYTRSTLRYLSTAIVVAVKTKHSDKI
jgi:transposase-like protein